MKHRFVCGLCLALMVLSAVRADDVEWDISMPGLRMTKIQAMKDLTTPIDEVTLERMAAPKKIEVSAAGVIMCSCGNKGVSYGKYGTSWTNPDTGTVWTRPANDCCTFVYDGWIFLQGGVTYRFGECVFDWDKITIDDETVIDSPDWRDVMYGTISRETSGWYPIEVRIGHEGGDVGCNNTFGGYCLVFTTSDEESYSESGAWKPLENTVDDIFLAAAQPTAITAKMTADSVVFYGAMLTADLVREGVEASDVYACYGTTDGGKALATWDHAVQLPVGFAAGATRNAVRATGLPPETAVLRFYSLRDGWTDPLEISDLTKTVEPRPLLENLAVTETNIVDALIALDVVDLGTDAECLDLALVLMHDGIVHTNEVAKGDDAIGRKSWRLTGLKPDTAYTVYAVASNGLAGGAAEMSAVMFRTGAESCQVALAPQTPGLWMTKINDNFDVTTPVRLISNAEVDPNGATMTGCGSTGSALGMTWTNPLTGTTWTRAHNDGKTVAYQGYIYLEGGVTYRFGECAYDYAKLSVDGEVMFNDMAYDKYTYGEIVRSVSGWYPIDIRLGHQSGSVGSAGVFGGYSIVYTTSGETAYATSELWKPLTNTTDNVFLCADDKAPVGEGLSVRSFSFDGRSLSANLSRTGVEPSEISVCLGAEYGGTSLEAWGTVELLSAGFAENETSRLAEVASIPLMTRYLRFFSACDGWSPTIYLPDLEVADDSELRISDPAVDGTGLADATVSVGVLSFGGAASCDILAICDHDGFTTTNALFEGVTVRGTLNGTVKGLLPGSHYSIRLLAVTDGGATFESDAVSFDTVAEVMDRRWLVTQPGLWMTKIAAHFDTETPVRGAPAEILAEPKKIEIDAAGVTMADVGSARSSVGQSWTNPDTLTVWSRGANDGCTYAYQGYVYLEGGVTYRFGECVYDYGQIVIDGQTVIYSKDPENTTYGEIERPQSGWFTIDVRIGHTGGGTGNKGSFNQTAFVYTTSDEEAFSNSGNWKRLLNTADNVFLAAEPPVRLDAMSVDRCRFDGTALSVTVHRTDTFSAPVFLCHGSVYGGDDTNDWEQVTAFGGFASGEIVATFDGNAPEGFAAARYMRLWSPGNGWTRTLGVGELASPEEGLYVAAISGLTPTATDAALTVDVAGAAEGTCDVFAALSFSYRNGAEDRTYAVTNRVLRGVGTGTYAVRLAPLCPGAAYELALFTANADGTHFRLPQEGAFAFATAADAQPESGACTLLVATATHKARDGRLDLTVSRPAAEGETVLYAAFGSADGGVDTAAWRHSERIGAFAAGETSVGVPSPAMGPSAKYMRLYTSDGEWSKTILVPATGHKPTTGFAVILR